MKRFLIAVAAVAALLILPQRPAVTRAPPSSQPSAQLPTGPRTVHQSAMDPTMPSGPIDAVQIVLDFAPGAWTPPHWHGGPLLVTVVDR